MGESYLLGTINPVIEMLAQLQRTGIGGSSDDRRNRNPMDRESNLRPQIRSRRELPYAATTAERQRTDLVLSDDADQIGKAPPRSVVVDLAEGHLRLLYPRQFSGPQSPCGPALGAAAIVRQHVDRGEGLGAGNGMQAQLRASIHATSSSSRFAERLAAAQARRLDVRPTPRSDSEEISSIERVRTYPSAGLLPPTLVVDQSEPGPTQLAGLTTVDGVRPAEEFISM